MYVTVTITTPDDSADIQIDSRQHIQAAGDILYSTGKSLHGPTNFYRSRMQRRVVSALNTFDEEAILTGDELTLIEERAQ